MKAKLNHRINFGKIISTLPLLALLSSCASSPDELSTTYVSPLKYKDYDCDQIIMEMDHVSKRAADLYQSLEKKSDNDAVAMGIGLVVFFPALFFLEGGDGPEAQEYSNLKGEFEALRTTVIQKKCESENMPKSPEEIIKERSEEENK